LTKKRETWSYVNKWYIIVPLLYLAIVFLAPLLKMLYMSFFEFQGVGQDLGAFTLENYLRFITDAYYWKVLGLSVLLSFISCIFCVIMGYPVAYKIARMQGRAKSILTVIVVLPLWVSITVRMFGWMSVLSENGLLDMLVHVFNPQGDSISLMGTYGSVLIGLIHCGLPYMIMILIGPIGNVSQSVEEASYVFGAGFWKTIFKVTLPLTFEGIVSGFILCFALNTAAFVVPVMLGSGKIVVMTTLIYQQATYIYDWGFAAAISVIFLIVATLLTNLDKLYGLWGKQKRQKQIRELQSAEE
jgi:ABC-type spermidine/putrescine transport system permease subunit I